MISRALETVPGDSIAAGRLLSLLGRFIGLEDGDYDAAQNTIKRALEIARKQGDEAAEIQALLSSAVVNAYEINWRAGIEDGLRALDLVNNIKDPRAEILVRSFCVYPQIATGALEHAKRNAADMLVLAKNLRELLPLSNALWCSELAARLSGEWQEILTRYKIWHAPVNDYDAVVADPQVRHNTSFATVDGATGTPHHPGQPSGSVRRRGRAGAPAAAALARSRCRARRRVRVGRRPASTRG